MNALYMQLRPSRPRQCWPLLIPVLCAPIVAQGLPAPFPVAFSSPPLIALAAPFVLNRWIQFGGEAVLFGGIFWALSFMRFRGLRESRQQAQRELADCQAELESEKSVLTTLKKLPARDNTTQAWNRTAIMEILVREMLRSVRENVPLGIVIAELDDLQGINALRGRDAAEA